MFAKLLTPNPEINYGVLASAYAVMALLAVLLFVLQEHIEGIKGFWMVVRWARAPRTPQPAPTLPCLFYALLMRARQSAVAPAKKDD